MDKKLKAIRDKAPNDVVTNTLYHSPKDIVSKATIKPKVPSLINAELQKIKITEIFSGAEVIHCMRPFRLCDMSLFEELVLLS